MNKAKVLIIGSDSSVKGGITTVISQFLNNQFKEFFIEHLPTYIEGGILKKISFFIKNYIIFIKKVILGEFDIAHIHMSYKGSFYRKLLIVLVLKLTKKKFIIHLHGSEFEVFYKNSNKIIKKLIRFTLRSCDSFIVLGENWKGIISNIEPKTKIFVLKNSIRIPDFKVNRNINKFNVLFLGVLIKRKGIYELIEAIRILSENNIITKYNLEFNIAGVGKEESDIKNLINKYNLDYCINMLGWIDGKQKEKLLKSSQLFVLPSYNEGLPMAILEAMSYGIPTVATNVGSIDEVVINNNNGYLIKPGEGEKISKCIEDIISNNDKWTIYSENSKIKIKDEFDEKVYFGEVEKLYTEILNK